jgi:hypothetical protein
LNIFSDAFDLPRLHEEVSRLLLEAAETSRDKDSEVVIVEGSFVLLHEGIRDRADVKVRLLLPLSSGKAGCSEGWGYGGGARERVGHPVGL